MGKIAGFTAYSCFQTTVQAKEKTGRIR